VKKTSASSSKQEKQASKSSSSKRELPFESGRLPKKTKKVVEVLDSDPDNAFDNSFTRKTKTTSSSTTVKKNTVKKSDERTKLYVPPLP
jgi:hypothetical protein